MQDFLTNSKAVVISRYNKECVDIVLSPYIPGISLFMR